MDPSSRCGGFTRIGQRCRRSVEIEAGDRHSAIEKLRVLSRAVEHAGHRYHAAVIAPLAPVRAQHAEMLRAMGAGVVITRGGGGGRLVDRAPDVETTDPDGRTGASGQ